MRRVAGAGVLLALAACAPSAHGEEGAVYRAWAEQRSYVEVTAQGSVARVLGIRTGPSGPHEGFLLHLRGADGHGLTVRVEDNVAITGPVPIAAGDDLTVRGEYIYDARGGVIHWTHHDPRGRHQSGYLDVGGRRYQ